MDLPISVTAIVHLKFHFDKESRKIIGEAEIQLIDELMAQASDLDPELQELLLKFANYMKGKPTSNGGPEAG